MADGSGWPTWKCAALTGTLCAIPLLLPALVHPVAVIAVWLTLVALYLGLVKMFGPGFVVQGAVIVLLLSILVFLVSPRLLELAS